MVFKVDVLKEFYKEVYKCVFMKFNWVLKEYKKDINRFLIGILIRLVSKFYCLMKDFNEFMYIIYCYKKWIVRK